jgi:hypothetical protein
VTPEARAVKNFEYLAWRADMEGLPEPAPGPNYQPKDAGEMAGRLRCQVCHRDLRSHGLTEWHPVAGKHL